MKLCKTCGLSKPEDDFWNVGKRSPGKKQAHCKDCCAKKHAEWRKNNPEKIRSYWRSASRRTYAVKKLDKYGITEEEYQRLLEDQDGQCAICKKSESAQDVDGNRKPLCIDHDHLSGLVRGLLCTKCNSGLGMFDDDSDYLLAAVEYLKTNSE